MEQIQQWLNPFTRGVYICDCVQGHAQMNEKRLCIMQSPKGRGLKRWNLYGTSERQEARKVKEIAEELQDARYENSSAYAVGRVEKGDKLFVKFNVHIILKARIGGIRQTTKNKKIIKIKKELY